MPFIVDIVEDQHIIRTLLLWRQQSINPLAVRGEIHQPFGAKMRQLYE